MSEKQLESLNSIRHLAENLTQLQIEYWQSFSNFGGWQFWVLIFMLILPLIVLFMAIDRSKMLLIGIFGLNYHVWFAYVNATGIGLGLWEYPYHLIPFLPSFSLDASLVPVSFMLLYQWTLNSKRNIYLYAVLLSAVFAFVLKPIMVNIHLFHMFKGVNYIHLFLFIIVLFIVSKLITNLFIWMEEPPKMKL